MDRQGISCFEIYNEDTRDLLAPENRSRSHLVVREDARDAHQQVLGSVDDLVTLLRRENARRACA